MRILHTSDWHLGQHFYGKSRALEHQAFLTWLIEQVTEQAIDLVIVAGDIFDTGTPPSYAREMYFEFIVQLSKHDCQLVIVAGNHDSVAMLNESKTLLNHLNTHVIPMASDNINEQVFELRNKQQQVAGVICAIPFIRPRDVMQSQAGQSATDKQRNLQQAIVDHYQSLFEQAQQLASHNGQQRYPIIATGHLTTMGVKTSESVRDIYIGTLEAFPANAFPKADYIALGHIHRSQKVAKTEHIRYSGSPIPLSFDEANQKKSVLVVEFDEVTLTSVTPLTIPRFQPMVMVKTTLDDLIDEVSAAVNACERADDKKVWLDIEISSADYLHDLHLRITQLVNDLPVEILLVRRAKKARQAMPSAAANITLDELTLEEVFNQRLAQAFPELELESEPSNASSPEKPERESDATTEEELSSVAKKEAEPEIKAALIQNKKPEAERKARLTQLFSRLVNEVKHQDKADGNVTTANDTNKKFDVSKSVVSKSEVSS